MVLLLLLLLLAKGQKACPGAKPCERSSTLAEKQRTPVTGSGSKLVRLQRCSSKHFNMLSNNACNGTVPCLLSPDEQVLSFCKACRRTSTAYGIRLYMPAAYITQCIPVPPRDQGCLHATVADSKSLCPCGRLVLNIDYQSGAC
jgi:hypothetical protein